MQKINFISTLLERFFLMFMGGERIKDIKSLCLTDYANYLYKIKNIDKAVVYYNKSLYYNPNNSYAYGGLAAALVEKKLFRDALNACNMAISLKKSGRIFILQSVIYEARGESDLSEKSFQQSLKFFDDKLEIAYDQLSYTFWLFNMYEEAEHYCKEAIKMNPNNAEFHYHLATIYLAKRQYQIAKDEFQKVLELTSDKRYKKYAIENIKRISKRGSPIKRLPVKGKLEE